METRFAGLPTTSHLEKRDLGTIFTKKKDFRDQFSIKIGTNLKKRDKTIRKNIYLIIFKH